MSDMQHCVAKHSAAAEEVPLICQSAVWKSSQVGQTLEDFLSLCAKQLVAEYFSRGKRLFPTGLLIYTDHDDAGCQDEQAGRLRVTGRSHGNRSAVH
jgi:hypothetical protein